MIAVSISSGFNECVHPIISPHENGLSTQTQEEEKEEEEDENLPLYISLLMIPTDAEYYLFS